MAVIHEKGLLEGRRLRKCSPLARLFWPYLFSMSNGFARLELDYELLEERLFSFKELRPDAKKLEQIFTEYANNHLILLYEVNGAKWGQWDTKKSDLKKYKSSEDENCPNPNDEEYRAWLQQQHGDRWEQFYCGPSQGESAFTKNLRKSVQNVSAHLPNVFNKAKAEAVGRGGAVGVGVGGAVAVAEGNGQSAQSQLSSSSTDETTAQEEAAKLLSLFSYLSQQAGNDQSGNIEDFRSLLQDHTYSEIAEMLVWSLMQSDYWPTHMRGSRHFRNSFNRIYSQASKFDSSKLRKLVAKFEEEMKGGSPAAPNYFREDETFQIVEDVIPANIDDDEDFS